MKLSTRIRYGTRAVTYIACYAKNKPVSLRQMCEHESIPIKYLESILLSLKKAHIIDSIRGSRGGYLLKRSPQSITLYDIIKALSGKIAIIDCIETDDCIKKDTCVFTEVWNEINSSIINKVQSIYLSDILKRLEDKKLCAIPMFHI
ncbi:RrF2 family transcriptional regulator [Chlamydiota bacterium]